MIVYPKFKDESIVISNSGIIGTVIRICNYEFQITDDNVKGVKLLGWNPYVILEDNSLKSSDNNVVFTYAVIDGNGGTHRFVESELDFYNETEYDLAINYSVNFCLSELFEAIATRKYCIQTLVEELLNVVIPPLNYRDWLRYWCPKDLDHRAGWKGHTCYDSVKMSQYDTSYLNNNSDFSYNVFVTEDSITLSHFKLSTYLLPTNQRRIGLKRGDRPLQADVDKYVIFKNKRIVIEGKVITEEHYKIINQIYEKAKRTYRKLLLAAFRKYDKTTKHDIFRKV